MKPEVVATTWYGIDLRWAYADLLGGIYRRTGCVHRAYDVLHDALVRVALARRLAPIPEPHAYVRTVVKSVLIDRYREESRFVPLPDDSADAVPDADPSLIGDSAPSAERIADLNQRLRSIERVIDCLPPRCRQVFWYYCIEGWTQPQIAATLDISLKVVERHLVRAMVDIRTAREDVLG